MSADDIDEDDSSTKLTQSQVQHMHVDVFGEQADKLKNFIETNEVLNTNAFNATSIKDEADVFVEKFWQWKDFNQYLICLMTMIGTLVMLTYFFKDSQVFKETLGSFSSLIEAMLGLP
mmetsp:Transcript_25582/g.39361  ORF Transcript_25582/g.39361 Transcript_25582/m.39361 type:complete len:118 (+) Transcript_25582:416-769(+)|eukprot:CAMPEP_0170485734 /NCGR_PEP_ID=MMETSP0208-20121228/4919_1 /TAXON_ID=197538 /ORGANISM="Strombidium inclinatum, Strain S3" /LENGTH=117 /DNA_ID=CAMNT_0010759459 /DNA_START=391 /DNA_END=744 /DNA_ORIENTATION=-